MAESGEEGDVEFYDAINDAAEPPSAGPDLGELEAGTSAEDGEASLEEQRTQARAAKDTPAPHDGSYLASWGGVFSAISEVGSGMRASAMAHLDKVYDALDPALPEEPAEGEKSFKTLFEHLRPASPGGSLIEGLDRTFDFATDRLGQALLGGLRRLESSVGVAIEPVSSASSVCEAGDGPSADAPADLPAREASPDGAENGAARAPPSIYAAGWSTLERLGRTTADMVASTKDRLAPLLDGGLFGAVGPLRITRADLKQPLAAHVSQQAGDEALEKLQIRSAEAAVLLRTKMKALTPRQLSAAQARLRDVGRGLDAIVIAPDGAHLDWSEHGGLFLPDGAEVVARLQAAIASSTAICAGEGAREAVEELRLQADTPLPPDSASLVVYLARRSLARTLSGTLFLLLCLDFDRAAEARLARLAASLSACLAAAARLAECPLVDAARRAAVCDTMGADVREAQALLSDALQTLQPSLRLARLRSGQDAASP